MTDPSNFSTISSREDVGGRVIQVCNISMARNNERTYTQNGCLLCGGSKPKTKTLKQYFNRFHEEPLGNKCKNQ